MKSFYTGLNLIFYIVFIIHFYFAMKKLKTFIQRKPTIKKPTEPLVVLPEAQNESLRRITKKFFSVGDRNFRKPDEEMVFTDPIFDKLAKGPSAAEREVI